MYKRALTRMILLTEPPAPPTGLQVLEVTSQSVRLSWQIQTAAQSGFNDVIADAPRISKFIVELAEIQGRKNLIIMSRIQSNKTLFLLIFRLSLIRL